MRNSDAEREQRLRECMDQYGDSVLRLCFTLLGDRGLAEDALQDTFIKVWKNLDTFEARNGSSLKTWIMHIAVNTCKDYRKQAWRKHIELSDAIDTLPFIRTEGMENSREILESVMALPIKYRQPVLLYYWQDMTLDEIGKVLNVSQSTAHYRLKKAQEMLKKTLKEDWQ